MTENSLTKKAMIVSLTISMLGTSKKDKAATDEIIAIKGADVGAGNFNKRLFPKEAVDRITDAASEIRSFHRDNTLPWNDEGSRLLASKNYSKYNEMMTSLTDTFNERVDEFVSCYDDHIKEARERLGEMFNENDYKDVSVIKDKFGVKFTYFPIPTAKDFRIDLSAEELQVVQDQIEKDVNAKYKHAMSSAWNDVNGKIKRLIERLEDPDRILRARLIDSIKELIPVLETFNINDDPEFEEIINEIKNNICSSTTAELNKDQKKCEEVIENAKSVVAKISDYQSFFDAEV